MLQISWCQSNHVPLSLCQTNVILCPDKKGPGSKAKLSLSKAPPLQGAKRRQSSAGGSLRARSPGPTQLSSLREPGTQPNWPSGSPGHPKRRDPGRWSQRQGWMGERFPAAPKPGSSQWGGLAEGSRALQDTGSLGSGPTAHPLARDWVSQRALRRRPGSTSYLTLLLRIPLLRCPNPLPNCGFPLVGCTKAPTNS